MDPLVVLDRQHGNFLSLDPMLLTKLPFRVVSLRFGKWSELHQEREKPWHVQTALMAC